MYITSLIINGFKSFNEEEIMDELCENFNEITELNEPIKSDLLDAFSFVFGTTKLDEMSECEKLSLIYESGSTEKKMASVSVTFDNENKAKTPPGYNLFDEITITREIDINGTSKYTFDGITNYLEKGITDFYASLKLDTLNPYFFITQDTVKKIINMEPIEILSVVEKACGIDKNTWQEREQTARKIIEAKDKLMDIYMNKLIRLQPVVNEIDQNKEITMKSTRVLQEIRDCYEHIQKLKDYLKENESSDNYNSVFNELKVTEEKKLELHAKSFDLMQEYKLFKSTRFTQRANAYRTVKKNISLNRKIVEQNREIINNLKTDRDKIFNEVYPIINDHFDKIIQSLLPSSIEYGKLEQTVDGLIIKVKFNNDQEDKSLADLSGCDKSLVALGFIMAVLKYKPSSIYIVDEIDLDFNKSQTQNAVKVLADNFTESQVIIISSKGNIFSDDN